MRGWHFFGLAGHDWNSPFKFFAFISYTKEAAPVPGVGCDGRLGPLLRSKRSNSETAGDEWIGANSPSGRF